MSFAALLRAVECLEGREREAQRGYASALPLPEELKKRRRRKMIKSSGEEWINSTKKLVPPLNPMMASFSEQHNAVPSRSFYAPLRGAGVTITTLEGGGAGLPTQQEQQQTATKGTGRPPPPSY